jgi:mono/diheme cytochrome c family protein
MRFLIPFILGLLALPVGAYFYIKGGHLPADTSAPALPFERWAAGTALHAQIAREMPKESPVAANESNYVAGAKVYRTQCAVCHGLPGQPESDISKGMFPKVPLLWKHGVDDDPVGETYWKVANGIRLTGMPGFKGNLTDEQMWQVSLVLANAPKLPASAMDILKQPLKVE